MISDINGITIEHLDGMRKRFNCYYSDIFMGMYNVTAIEDKLVRVLLWSVEKDNYLPTKEKFIEYQETFLNDKKVLKEISEILKRSKSG